LHSISLLDVIILLNLLYLFFFFFQAEDGIRDATVTGVQTCALPIYSNLPSPVRYNKGKNTINADAAQGECQSRKDNKQKRRRSGRGDRFRNHRTHGLDFADGGVWIDASDEFAKRGSRLRAVHNRSDHHR